MKTEPMSVHFKRILSHYAPPRTNEDWLQLLDAVPLSTLEGLEKHIAGELLRDAIPNPMKAEYHEAVKGLIAVRKERMADAGGSSHA